MMSSIPTVVLKRDGNIDEKQAGGISRLVIWSGAGYTEPDRQ